MTTLSEKVMRRLQVVATSRPEIQLRTLNTIRNTVEADGSSWGKFLSLMNKSVAGAREDIVQAFDNQDLDSIVEILSDSMQDLLDALADEFGFEFDDEEGEGEEGSYDEEDDQTSTGSATQERQTGGTTVIE